MHCKWKEHLFMGYDDITWDIVQYEFVIHLFLHTRYSQVCLLTVSLTNALDYRSNLQLLFLVTRSLQAERCINCFSSRMTCFVAPFWENWVPCRVRVLRTPAWYAWSPGFRSWHWDQASCQVFLWCSSPSGSKFQDSFLLSFMLRPHYSVSIQFILHK